MHTFQLNEETVRLADPSDGADVREITDLLGAWKRGEPEAGEECFDRLYPDLSRIAAQVLARERRTFGCEPRELLHEAYIRLVHHRAGWRDRSHFFATAARLMRRIVVDRVKHFCRLKRGNGAAHLPLEEVEVPAPPPTLDRLALRRAMSELASIDDTAARVAVLRYLEGLSLEEVAEALGIGRATVVRAWKSGRTFLDDRL